MGDVPLSDGPLAILEGSHRLEELQQTYGKLDVDRDKEHPYVGGWLSKDAPQVRDTYGGRWLTTEFELATSSCSACSLFTARSTISLQRIVSG